MAATAASKRAWAAVASNIAIGTISSATRDDSITMHLGEAAGQQEDLVFTLFVPDLQFAGSQLAHERSRLLQDAPLSVPLREFDLDDIVVHDLLGGGDDRTLESGHGTSLHRGHGFLSRGHSRDEAW